MGANAQTTVPTFTASQVLTAEQQNQSARTGVPVFSDTTTRDAAFGGSGEKTLAEGQLCYLESTNVVQYYDGASWATVGPSSAGGLVFITSASFSAVASVSFATGVFTATYQNYLVTFNLTASSGDQVLYVRVNNGGAARTASNYYGGKMSVDTSGNVVGTGTLGGTSLNVGADRNPYPFLGLTCNVFAPFDASTKTSVAVHGFGAINAANVSGHFSSAGYYDVAETNDGLTFVVSGTITGNYRVYGYANS